MNSACICPEHHLLDKNGYPRMKYQSRLWRGNRLIWTLLFGPIPENKVVAHSCNNSGCLNPAHLYLCSQQENSTDASKDGLYPTGDRNYKTRWDDSSIITMLNMYDSGMRQEKIGNIFGISQARVSECIKRARTL